MTQQDAKSAFHSGFISIVGRPNVGKSTLLNALVGEKVAIVTPKPQTTRNRLLGILTLEKERGDLADAQIVFVDTPGIHQPHHKLGAYMVETAVRAIPDADLVLFLVDVSQPPSAEDRQIADILQEQRQAPVFLVLNKSDALPAESAAAHEAAYQALGDWAGSMLLPISARTGDGIDILKQELVSRLPEGPAYFPTTMWTDPDRAAVCGQSSQGTGAVLPAGGNSAWHRG